MSRPQMVWLGIIGACLIAGGALFVAAIRFDQPRQPLPTPPSGEVAEDVLPAGTKRFTHPTLPFSLIVPEAVSVTTQPEEGGAQTAIFSSPEEGKEFQIFTLPYSEDAIESSRIEKDTHGTASGTPQEIVLGDGVHALAFFSSDPLLGDLREIWFLMNGHLIEVTTYRENDAWLAGILGSLKATGS